MRKILLNLAVSLDGFIEGPNGEFDWCFTDQDYGMAEFLAQTDAVLLGRKSFQLLKKMSDGDPFPNHAKYVFSNTLAEVSHPYILAKGPAEDTVRLLRNSPGKDLWLFGGSELVASLLNAGLIDELVLAVHPILLGNGKPLVAQLNERVPLKLLQTKTYDSGLVQLFYRIVESAG